MKQSSLRHYYQRELKILREDGAAFAARYPKMAPHLGLIVGQNPDPMVERLLESMAYLTARIRQESEAELPGLAGQILDQMCPSLAAPVPSISVVSFNPDYRELEKQNKNWHVAAGTKLYSSPLGEAPVIRWQTGWPLDISSARVTAVSQAVMGLKSFGGESGECAVLRLRFTGLRGGEKLRLFLKGDRFATFPLHDWVHTATHRLFLVDDADRADRKFKHLALPRNFLKPAGLEPDDLILPGRNKSWVGFRLIQEYFACPERFLFWELGPWPDLQNFSNGTVDLLMLMTKPPPEGLEPKAEMFDSAAVPIVNLFERQAEPIHLDHRRTGYQLCPDLRRTEFTEVHSVLSVAAFLPGGEKLDLPGYFDSRDDEHKAGGLCWRLRLKPSPDERGAVAEFFFTGGDMDEEMTAMARVLCTNGHWASLGGCVELQSEVATPGSPLMVLAPSPHRDPAWQGDVRWRLVANFAMSQEALSGAEGLTVLKNLLYQYAPPEDAYSQRQIAGIMGLKTELMFHPLRPSPDHPIGGLARGLNIDLELDDDAFHGGSPFVFASILEVFMGLRAAINQVTRMRLFLDEHKGIYHQWSPRCGMRELL